MNQQKINTFEIVRLIREAPKEILSSTETGLLMMMAHIGNKEGKKISPGVKWLAEYTKLSKMSVIRLLNSLVSKKVLIIAHNRKRGSHENTFYEINVDLLNNIRSNRGHQNKINPEKIKPSPEDKCKKYGLSSSNTVLPESSNTVLPEDGENYAQVVTQCYLPSNTVLPESSNTVLPRTNTPIIKTIYDQDNVKSEEDLIPIISQKKSKKLPKEKTPKKNWSVETLEVFEHWKKTMGHPGAKFDEARKKKIRTALDTHGYTVEELKKAIDGNKKSAWHQGENSGGAIHHSIGLIFRNPEKIEQFIGKVDTEGAVKNKNVATAQKMSFTERNKKRVNMFSDLEEILFPEFANRPQMIGNKECLLTFNKENEINERK